MAHGVGESRDTPDAARLPSWFSEPMNGNSKHLTRRGVGAVMIGLILLTFALFVGLAGLSIALSDPCSGVSGCQPIFDMRPIGWMVAAFGLAVGLPAAWMVYWGARLTSD